MKLKFLLAACVLLASGSAVPAADKRFIDLPELAEAPAANDVIALWDITLGDMVKMTRANFLSGAPLSGNNITSGTIPDARLSANVSQLGPSISLAEMATMDGNALLGRATAGTGAVERIPVSGKFVFNLGQLDLAQSYIIDDPQISDLSDGSLSYQLGLDGGYSLGGPAIVDYPAMVGTQMDLSKPGETLIVTSSVSLTHLGSAATGQFYVLHLVGDGANTWTVTLPAMFSAPDEGPLGPITVNPQSNMYLTKRWEGAQWNMLSNPAASTGAGPYVLRDAPQINTPTINGAVTWQDGVKQTNNPNNTTAGHNPGSNATEMTVPANGDWFYKLGTGFLFYQEGAWVPLGGGGSGTMVPADFDTADKLAALLGAGDYTGSGGFVRANSPSLTGTWGFQSITADSLLADELLLTENDGVGAQTVELYAASSHAANRRWGINFPDSAGTTTIPATGTLVVQGGALGTPSSGTLTNATGLPLATGVSGTLPVANGGTGTASPGLVEGSGIDITGTWPNQTIAATGGGGGAPTIAGFRQNVFLWEEFLQRSTPASSAAHQGDFALQRVSNGAGSTGDNEVSQTGAPGIASVETGTTTTGYSFLRTADDAFYLGGGSYDIEGRFWIPVARDETQDFSFVFGFHDAATALPLDGAYFLYDSASANWQINTRSNSTGSPTASSTAVAIAAWVKLRIVVNAAASSVAFYVDGTEVNVSPLTENIPTAVNRQTGIRFGIIKSAGTVTREVWCDYLGAEIGLSSSR